MLVGARDSMVHADMKDGSMVDVDSEGGVLAVEAVVVVGAGVDVDVLVEAHEVLHYQRARHLLQRDLVLYFGADRKEIE